MAVSPLNYQVAITDDKGRPTPEFLRWWQDQRRENERITDLNTAAEIGALLDKLGDAQGALLYRGATAWAAFPPGPAGQVLQTQGAGADPAWADLSFLSLTDTPAAYTGQAGRAAIVNVAENGLEFGDVAASFLSLTDTPVAYTGQAGLVATVNAAEDGIEFAAGGGSNPLPYDIGFEFSATPTAGQVIRTVPIVRQVTFEADFAGSVGVAGTNPAAAFTLSVQDDSVEIGTVTISTGGVFAFATTVGTEKVVEAGSTLAVIAPATPDVAVSDVVVTLFGTATFAPPVTVDSATVLKLDFENGTVGLQDATDTSIASTPLTWFGEAQVQNTQVKQGTKGLQMNSVSGNNDRLSIPNINFGDDTGGDFTIEMWVYHTGASATYFMGHMGTWNDDSPVAGAWELYIRDTPARIFDFYVHPGTLRLVGTTSVSLNTWHHLAVTRTGNVHRAFLDGVLETTQTISGVAIQGSPAQPVLIGNAQGGLTTDNFAGYMDLVRIVKGISLYPSDTSFTPPTGF